MLSFLVSIFKKKIINLSKGGDRRIVVESGLGRGSKTYFQNKMKGTRFI
jgi:hypothetical protein